MSEERLVIGLIEKIILENNKCYEAKVDTGADSSSIDENLLSDLGNKKIISYKTVRSALGRHKRPMVYLEIEFQGKKFREKFTVSDRKELRYKILIGQDILKKEKFLIDPVK